MLQQAMTKMKDKCQDCSSKCFSKCDQFLTKHFGECWFILAIVVVGPIMAVVLAVLVLFLFSWLLSTWFHHDIDPAGMIHDPFFYIMLVLFIIPAFTASVALLIYGLLLIVKQPNTLGLGWVTWKDLAYFAVLASVGLFTVSFKASLHDWTAIPPLPALWLCYGCTFLWLPYSLISGCRLLTISSWSGIRGEVQGQELEALRAKVAERCQAYERSYRFIVTVEKAYYVSSPPLEEKFDDFCERHREKGKTPNRKELFHGTLRSSAKSIIESGFRLPMRAGMFGKGVYFADTPLKSMQYTGPCTGAMLLCEVELGNTMMKSIAANNIEPETDMQRSWLMKSVFRAKSFDSLTARAGLFGSVRVPEYVIYRPEQAVPRYLLLLKQHRKSVTG